MGSRGITSRSCELRGKFQGSHSNENLARPSTFLWLKKSGSIRKINKINFRSNIEKKNFLIFTTKNKLLWLIQSWHFIYPPPCQNNNLDAFLLFSLMYTLTQGPYFWVLKSKIPKPYHPPRFPVISRTSTTLEIRPRRYWQRLILDYPNDKFPLYALVGSPQSTH